MDDGEGGMGDGYGNKEGEGEEVGEEEGEGNLELCLWCTKNC